MLPLYLDLLLLIHELKGSLPGFSIRRGGMSLASCMRNLVAQLPITPQCILPTAETSVFSGVAGELGGWLLKLEPHDQVIRLVWIFLKDLAKSTVQDPMLLNELEKLNHEAREKVSPSEVFSRRIRKARAILSLYGVFDYLQSYEASIILRKAESYRREISLLRKKVAIRQRTRLNGRTRMADITGAEEVMTLPSKRNREKKTKRDGARVFLLERLTLERVESRIVESMRHENPCASPIRWDFIKQKIYCSGWPGMNHENLWTEGRMEALKMVYQTEVSRSMNVSQR